MRFLKGLIAVCLAGGAISAQSVSIFAQEVARARQLLQSTQMIDKAWGAYFAGRLHSDELREPLIEQFRAADVLRDAPSWSEDHAFLLALFDAAIRSDITVPAELLQPFEEKWAYPVLILLARDGADSEDSLLRLSARESQGMVWLTANNLLAEKKSQRWFSRLLSEISVTHQFKVWDPGQFAPGSGGATGGGVYGDGGAAMPKGFPPITIYTLQVRSMRGSVLLARGPENVYYERTTVPTDKQVGYGAAGPSFKPMEIRMGYLAQLAGKSTSEVAGVFRATSSFPYRGQEQFLQDVSQSLDAQEEDIRALLQKIAECGLDVPSGVHLQIVPEVIDERNNRTEPLPPAAPREIQLTR
jgi:hypothetical protein